MQVLQSEVTPLLLLLLLVNVPLEMAPPQPKPQPLEVEKVVEKVVENVEPPVVVVEPAPVPSTMTLPPQATRATAGTTHFKRVRMADPTPAPGGRTVRGGCAASPPSGTSSS